MSLRVTLAGGGTAGHIEPALAVAAAIKKIEPDAHCLFLGTESGLENLLIPKAGYELRFLPKVPLPRRLALSTFLFPFRALQSIIKARHAIKGSDIIIGFGGYVSAPAYIAARSMRIPIAIHEANAQPGWANRMARSWASAVAPRRPAASPHASRGSVMRRLALFFALAPLGVAILLFGTQVAGRALLSLGLAPAAARV